MMAVQRQLQESQWQLQQQQEDLVRNGEAQQGRINELMLASAAQQERLDALVELSAKHERRFTPVYGDRQTVEVDRLHLTEGSVALKRRVNWLERPQDES